MIDLGLVGGFELFFAFLIYHAFGDFVFQTDFIAKSKNRHVDSGERGIWAYSLTAHSLVHAAGVWVISGSLVLGVVEFSLHWLVDFGKCEKWYSFQADQLLHVLCKAGYVIFILTLS